MSQHIVIFLHVHTLFFCLFSIHVIIFFIVPCYLVKKDIISVLLNLLRFVLCLSVWSVLDRVPCALEKKVYSEFCGCNALKISIKSNCSIVPFRIFFALLIFYLEDVSTDASEVFKSPAAVAVLPMSPFMSVRICLCTWVCRYWVLVEAMVFPVVMYGCESWTVKKADHGRIDAFELWCWRRLESPLDCKEIQSVYPKGHQSWVFIGRTNAEAEIPVLWPPHAKS